MENYYVQMKIGKNILLSVSSFMVSSIAIFIIEGKLIGKLYTEISKYVLEAWHDDDNVIFSLRIKVHNYYGTYETTYKLQTDDKNQNKWGEVVYRKKIGSMFTWSILHDQGVKAWLYSHSIWILHVTDVYRDKTEMCAPKKWCYGL